MTDKKRPIRVIHVEDSDGWRVLIGQMMEKGLKRDGVVFESRPDFTQLTEEIASENPDDLPDVVILDNEAPGGEGAVIAQEVYNKAQAIGREVVIIHLLCSSPAAVRKEYGEVLNSIGVPICDKLMHAPLVGFYIGSCITDDGLKKVSFEDWLREENIHLPDEKRGWEAITRARDVQNSLMLSVSGQPGSLYLRPREFIATEHDNLTRFMKPETIAEIGSIFPPLFPGGERK